MSYSRPGRAPWDLRAIPNRTKARPRCLVAIVVYACAIAAAFMLSAPATAASPYTVDGIVLGSQFASERDYQCGPSVQFPDATWCQRKRTDRGKQGSFSSTTSVLHGRGGAVTYASREIAPAYFAPNDMKAEIKRLSGKFGAPSRELRLPEGEGLPTAMIVLWGSLQLEQLDPKEVSNIAPGAGLRHSLLVDHLGDIARSTELGLPVYRISGGSGYLWAASDQNGRGHLRFLTIDVAALSAKNVSPPSAPQRPAAASAETIKQPPETIKQKTVQAKYVPSPALGERARLDDERAKIIEAERLAAEDRAKARLAWVRFEEEKKAAFEARNRIKWILVLACAVLVMIIALLHMIWRRETNTVEQSASRMPPPYPPPLAGEGREGASPDGAERAPGLVARIAHRFMRATGSLAAIRWRLVSAPRWIKDIRARCVRHAAALRATATSFLPAHQRNASRA
jgi:hypothetical protein